MAGKLTRVETRQCAVYNLTMGAAATMSIEARGILATIYQSSSYCDLDKSQVRALSRRIN
jgi:hypothetical protein